MGQAAAYDAAATIREAIANVGYANIIVATGNSQLTFLHALAHEPAIDWSLVNVFHMDEYVGINPQHPASFPLFLHKHFVDVVRPGHFYPIFSGGDPQATCDEYEALLRLHPADLCALGIGENGHLAFNDPPANFAEPRWVIVVTLADSCKQQQVGEGHFNSLADVPTQAITLSIPALLAARKVLAIVPEARKAGIVYRTLTEPVSPLVPATILRRSSNAKLYLDADSGAQLMR